MQGLQFRREVLQTMLGVRHSARAQQAETQHLRLGLLLQEIRLQQLGLRVLHVLIQQ